MHSISILSRMKEILPNFQWNLPSKTREQDDQTLKTFCCEIMFWALRRVSVAIVTYYSLLLISSNLKYWLKGNVKPTSNLSLVTEVTYIQVHSYPCDAIWILSIWICISSSSALRISSTLYARIGCSIFQQWVFVSPWCYLPMFLQYVQTLEYFPVYTSFIVPSCSVATLQCFGYYFWTALVLTL